GAGQKMRYDRMAQPVRASATGGAPAIVKRIIEDVRNFAGSHPQNDDITLIAIRKTRKRFLVARKTKRRNGRLRKNRQLDSGPLCLGRKLTSQKIQWPACRPISTGFAISRCAVRAISRITQSVPRAERKKRSNTRTARCLSDW